MLAHGFAWSKTISTHKDSLLVPILQSLLNCYVTDNMQKLVRSKIQPFSSRPKITIFCPFIAHNEWVNTTWPDLRKLKNISLTCALATFACLIIIPISAFLFVSMPYDWPRKSFFSDVPKKNQMFVIAVVISLLMLPLIVSCITYILVYFSAIVKGEQGYRNSSIKLS